ncbi:hypothetical protein CCR75_003997 [Bremia lactucae]|uniref:EGF-like domain-containing protein n=1 Tax=Bremia lactucae TaxID=4779 RepID=A0A976IKF5_BRELC|nr:hypothetical protein CCR75_003997 [Bremia lactucae]
MHVWNLASVLAVLTLSQQVAAKGSGSKDRPGNCKDTEDCKTKGYECVALQTTRAGTETVKQCLPKEQDSDVCSGQYPGLCPSFSSWKTPYNQISSVCTYKPADKCVNGDESSAGSKGGVICVGGAKDPDGKTFDAIYGCADFDTSELELLFGEEGANDLAAELGTAPAIIEDCLSTNATSNSTLLCSGQGTCVPDAMGSLTYNCRCNIGYSGNFCEFIDSNKCQLPGQCATGVCNLDTQECECAAGTTGDQCSECDAKSSEACNGKGMCSNSVCKCEEGWEGLQCTKESAVKKSAKSTKKATTETTSGGTMLSAYSFGSITMSLAVLLAAIFFN